jgi:hypothetical protein
MVSEGLRDEGHTAAFAGYSREAARNRGKLPARAWKRGQDTLLFIANKQSYVCCRFFEHLPPVL